MKKKIKVKTNQGERIYRIDISSGKHFCYKEKTFGLDKIGESRSLEDALSLIRLHATSNFGGVKNIQIE